MVFSSEWLDEQSIDDPTKTNREVETEVCPERTLPHPVTRTQPHPGARAPVQNDQEAALFGIYISDVCRTYA